VSSSLKNIKISDSYPRLVQQVDGIFYDGAGNKIQGIGGPQGLRGPQGIGSGSLGPQGFQGLTGTNGSQGFQGFQGFQGPTGTNGTNGADALWQFMNSWSGGAIYDVGNIVTFGGETWYCLRYTVAGAGPFGGYIEGPTPYWQLLSAKGLTGATGSPGIGNASSWIISESPEQEGNLYFTSLNDTTMVVDINTIDDKGNNQHDMLTALQSYVLSGLQLVFSMSGNGMHTSCIVTSVETPDTGRFAIHGTIIHYEILPGPTSYTVSYTSYSGIPSYISSGLSAPGSAVVANPTNVNINFSDGVGTAWSFGATGMSFPNATVQTTAYIPKYKVFTALLTQSGGYNPHSITDTNLQIGVTYTIDGIGNNTDFTNVGAPNNLDGTSFIATGTTPNNWDGCNLLYNTGAPVATVLENTIGNVWFGYGAIGEYLCYSDGLFTLNKSFIIVGNIVWDGGSGLIKSGFDGDSSAIIITCLYDASEYVNNGSLLNTAIEIRVYN